MTMFSVSTDTTSNPFVRSAAPAPGTVTPPDAWTHGQLDQWEEVSALMVPLGNNIDPGSPLSLSFSQSPNCFS